MNYYKLVIAYDGTDFHGWQIQSNYVTLMSCLQDNFFRVFGTEVKLLGSSRTDTGVHALGQVARAVTDFSLDRIELQNAWNNSLPKSILVRSLEQITDQFHPLRNYEYKVYEYHLFYERPLPFFARYGWAYPFIRFVDVEKFKRALQLFVGTHDFASFGRVEGEKSTVRTVHSIDCDIKKEWGAHRVTVQGVGFLQYQIRRMIGAALDIARDTDASIEQIAQLLKTPKKAEQPLLRAEACGLCLKKVVYQGDER